MKRFRKSFTLFFVLATCCSSLSWAQPFRSFSSVINPDCATQEKRDNEFTYSGRPYGNFYCNPILLEGVWINDIGFALQSKGELKLVKGDPKTGQVVEIPFYLHLRRNGMLIIHPCGEGVIFTKTEISTILKIAKSGDELIVEPVHKEDWPAKRIIKIVDGC
jgi:hypothetical protein